MGKAWHHRGMTVSALLTSLKRLVTGRWSREHPQVVIHPAYRAPSSSLVDSQRAERICAWLLENHCITQDDIHPARPATIAELARVHDPEYLGRVQDKDSLARLFPGLSERDANLALVAARWMVGGTLVATRLALSPSSSSSPVVNLGGGFHHARRRHGSGFCAFNDIAAGVAQARLDGFSGSILVVDLDLHPGDGTREIFAQDPTVYTFSLHAVDPEPLETVADRCVALGPSVGDEAFLEALSVHLPEVIQESQPSLCLYVAGVDGALDDALGNWRLSPDGLLERDRRVVTALAGVPLVWLLAGGYGEGAWRYTARSLGALTTGKAPPLPSLPETRLHSFRAIAASLTAEDLGAPEKEDLGISTAELLSDLRGAPQETRFLGFYSSYGVEVALERYGVMEKVRARGYSRTRLDFHLDNPTGHLVRLQAVEEGRELLLIELVARESDEIPPFRLLCVEWLLLQDPHQRPSPERPLLPGQKHPGLGCLQEVVGMLIMAAERLSFDGLLYRPGGYHMAVLARGFMDFLEPHAEARFAAFRLALEGLTLGEASQAVSRGEVKDTLTQEPVRWEAAPLIRPLSASLKERVGGRDWNRELAAEVGRFRFEHSPREVKGR